MGLDFHIESNKELHAGWSYSGFMKYRRKLANEIGLVLNDMIGFGGDEEWPDAKDEPLVHLLDHSDCDGELTADQCRELLPRLKEIVDEWKERTPANMGFAYERYDIQQSEELCNMLEYCAEHGESLLFL
ncbi:hypothetical protein M0R72_18110 [Candidatus Pacearchaeota archaeon]|jgi:hypothetical protein|nr:hypothetical protein [Candidatus Pacearchaeota archaeon]